MLPRSTPLLLLSLLSVQTWAGRTRDVPMNDAIFHGDNVSPNDPMAASTAYLIHETDDGTSVCTASLIDRDILVTAAHCLDGSPEEFTVKFGVDGDSGKALKVRAFLAHPGYKPAASEGDDKSPPARDSDDPAKDTDGDPETTDDKDESDIGLVRLSEAVPSGFRAATVLADGTQVKPGSSLVVAGYGTIDLTEDSPTGTLLSTNVRYQKLWGNSELLTDESGGHSSCAGDSGGPLFVRTKDKVLLWGITSRGDAHCRHYGIYTRIDSYRDWIEQTKSLLRSK